MTGHFCKELRHAVEADDLPVTYLPTTREFGIEYTDGGTSYQLISHCPWHGAALPEPLADEWRRRLQEMGLEFDDARAPEEMRSERWWREAGL